MKPFLNFLIVVCSLVTSSVGIYWLFTNRITDGLLCMIMGELMDINRKVGKS